MIISGSPHIHGKQTTKRIMTDVIIALVPLAIVSFIFFGIQALVLTLVSIASCMAAEYLISRYLLKQQPTLNDMSAIVTGLLLAFNLPSNLPLWIVVIGALVAIGIGKMSFGGLGKNIFNPALVGRVFLLISFPVQMTSWPVAKIFNTSLSDGVTGPTILGTLKEGLAKGETVQNLLINTDYLDMLIGFGKLGSMGEISALIIILGGMYLLLRKVITWQIPVSFILSAFIFSGILYLVNDSIYVDPAFQVISGGFLLGAIFMATDMVTSPMTKTGQVIFGIGCGLLTILIRIWGSYPEGVSFAILIMNALVPLIDSYTKPKRF